MLRVLFERDVIEAQIQRRYMEEGKYDLCIDQGTRVTPLTSHKWSSIEPGTKIVMRVTIQQKTDSGSDIDYQCHFCGAVNRLGVKFGPNLSHISSFNVSHMIYDALH
jgi:hypothetical protein